jgi:hypothetical protein
MKIQRALAVALMLSWLAGVAVLAPPRLARADEPGEGTVNIPPEEPESSAAEPAEEEEAPEVDYTRDGWYAQAQGVYGLENFDLPSGESADDGTGFNLLAGYRMGRNFAGEVEFEFMNQFGLKDQTPDSFDFRTWWLGMNFRVYPLARLFAPDSWGNRVQPYLKAGAGWQWGQTIYVLGKNWHDGSFAARFGGGLDFYVTDHIVLTAGAAYQYITGDVNNYRYISLGGGIQYRFSGED